MKALIYERERYLEILDQLTAQAGTGTLPMAVIGGRRRLGKSYVPAQYFRQQDAVHYCVLKCPIDATESDTLNVLSETLSAFLESIGEPLNVQAPNFQAFFDMVGVAFKLSSDKPIILHLDEVQELRRFQGAEGFLATLIDHWREGRRADPGGLLLTGSMWRHLEPMFSGQKRPLFGRETHRTILYPWRPSTVAGLFDSDSKTRAADFLTAYAFTGGVPWYLHLLHQNQGLNGISQKPDEMIQRLYLEGPLKHEEIEVVNSHLRGDAQALFEGLHQGKTKRTHFKELIGAGNYQNFSRFIQRINENYEFIDLVADPLFPDQQGGHHIRVRDAFLFFTLTLGRKLLQFPLHLFDQIADSQFKKQWQHHEAWCLEEILYQIIGEHAATLGWKIDYNYFGMRINVAGAAEMDVVSYSPKENWVEVVEAKRSLQRDYLNYDKIQQKMQIIRSQLQKKYPKKAAADWQIHYRIVYVFDPKQCAIDMNQIDESITLSCHSLSDVLAMI